MKDSCREPPNDGNPSIRPANFTEHVQSVGPQRKHTWGGGTLFPAVQQLPSEIVTAVWSSAQLGGFTEHEVGVIRRYCEPSTLHLFCGLSSLGDVRVDLDATSSATIRADILPFLAETGKAIYRTVVADPPYNGKYQAEYGVSGTDFGGNEKNLGQLLKAMFRVCEPGGLLIFKHWFDPAWAGARLQHQVVTKYGGHRRITLLTVYRNSDWG